LLVARAEDTVVNPIADTSIERRDTGFNIE